MNLANHCANCAQASKSRRRDFSEQAWTLLLLWEEISKTAVDKPICDGCYNELREVLIDRASEVDQLHLNQRPNTSVARQQQVSDKLAS